MTEEFAYTSSDLLAFVDETGHPSMSDPSHRVFGLGGCAVPIGAYGVLLHYPWLALRARHFPELVSPMHAARGEPTQAQTEALAQFFLRTRVYRVAALVTPDSGVGVGEEAFETCATMLLCYLHQVAARNACDRIVLTFEAAGKADITANRLLQTPSRFASSSVGHIPVAIMRSRKEERVPGLEVADFVMHAAGGQVRRGLLDSHARRKDFEAVFSGVPDDWVYFGVRKELKGGPLPPAFPTL